MRKGTQDRSQSLTNIEHSGVREEDNTALVEETWGPGGGAAVSHTMQKEIAVQKRIEMQLQGGLLL